MSDEHADDVVLVARVLIRVLETLEQGFDDPRSMKRNEAQNARHTLLEIVERREANGEQPDGLHAG